MTRIQREIALILMVGLGGTLALCAMWAVREVLLGLLSLILALA